MQNGFSCWFSLLLLLLPQFVIPFQEAKSTISTRNAEQIQMEEEDMPFYKFMAKIRLEYTHTEYRRKEKSPIKIAKLQESMYTQTRTHSIQKLKMTVNDFVALVKCARFQFQWMGYGREMYMCICICTVYTPWQRSRPNILTLGFQTRTHLCSLRLQPLPDPWHISICWHWIAGYIYSNTFIFYYIGAPRHRVSCCAPAVPPETCNFQANNKQIARVKRVRNRIQSE